MRTGFYTGNYDHAVAALAYVRERLDVFEKTLGDGYGREADSEVAAAALAVLAIASDCGVREELGR